MGIITWIIVGIISGWTASALTRRNQFIVTNIIVGLVGAILGGFAANLVTRHAVLGFSWASLFVGILGAVVFLAFANAMQRDA